MLYLILFSLYMDNPSVAWSQYCGTDVFGYLLRFEQDEVLLLKTSEFHEDAIYNEEVLQSKYVCNDSLVIIKNYRLKVLDDKRLEVISLQGVKKGTILYCRRRHYSNGKLKFLGDWENGKQDGIWFYFDPKGKITQVTYRSGIIIKQIDNPVLDPRFKVVFSRTWRKRQIE